MKKFTLLPLGLIFCSLLSCQNKEVLAELEVFKTQVEIEAQNKEIVLKLYEEIDNQNFDAAIELFTSDAQIYGSGGFDPAKPDDLKPVFPAWFVAFPDYAHSIEDIIAKGDKVSARMIYSGTHNGEFFGAPATGNTIKYLGIHTHTIKDGKIVESWILEDMFLLWQQLGMELNTIEQEN